MLIYITVLCTSVIKIKYLEIKCLEINRNSLFNIFRYLPFLTCVSPLHRYSTIQFEVQVCPSLDTSSLRNCLLSSRKWLPYFQVSTTVVVLLQHNKQRVYHINCVELVIMKISYVKAVPLHSQVILLNVRCNIVIYTHKNAQSVYGHLSATIKFLG